MCRNGRISQYFIYRCLDYLYGQIQYGGEQIHSLNPHPIYKWEVVSGSKNLEYWGSLKYFYINCVVK